MTTTGIWRRWAACWGLTALSLGATPAHAMTSVPYGGLMAAHSGKCLAIEAGSTLAGARVLQAGCRHIGSDQWQVQPIGAFVQLAGQQAGQCLAVTGASLTQGAQVVQTSCATADHQLWSLVAQSGGYALKAKHSGQCLDVTAASQADAAPLIQWPCTAQPNQTFQFERRLFAPPSALSIVGAQSGQCVNVYGGFATAGTAAIQWPCAGRGNDTWTLRPIGQAVSIVSSLSGQCLDVTASSQTAGATVIQWPCTGNPNQLWRLQPYNNTWRLVASHSGQCLNVTGGGSTPGTALIQWPCSGDANELWSLHMPTPIAKWSGVIPTTVDPVAAANLPNGTLLAWSADQALTFGTGSGQTYTEVLDPTRGTESVFLVSNTGHDMFCPGTALLPDGRVLVNGGIDSPRTSLYNPASSSWSDGGNMSIGRGYEGTATTAEGTVLTLGGSWSGTGYGGRTGELWTSGKGWSLLPGVPATPVLTADVQGVYRADNHLWLHSLSGGRLLHSGPSKQMNWIDPRANGGQGSIVSAGLRGDDADSINGNAVLYDIDKILKLGGASSYGYGATGFNATASAQVINAAGAATAVQRVAPMAYARAFGNSVVLPSGQVMVVGGQTVALPFSDDNAIFVPELWDPASQVFERLPPMATPRNYHSVALLLPDARVWVAGGGLCGGCATNHANYEILTPPYLLNDNGTAAIRPAIQGVSPATPVLGSALQVTTAAPITSFALIRLASVTHSVNNDQRRIPLAGTTTDGRRYTLTLPADPGIVVPGYYMLFALDAKGVPSMAYTLRVAAS